MGVVYRARDTKLGRPVALKFLPQQWSHDEAARQRFMREAQAASATHHPNICTIHDIERADDGQLFIVMAFYEGLTLKQRLVNGPMALDEALEIATQVADGLAKAHAQGVVHRDIKPGNVMLTEDGVRILDFGLATFVDALKLTTENTSLGTPAYMSPEQVRGQGADARSDVWAVGVLLYEMLAGHVPFQGAYAEAVAHAIRHEAAVPLRVGRPDVPEEVEQLVFRALHKEPSVRYQSGRELARTIRQIRGLSVPLELRTAPVTLPVPSRPRRITPQMRLRTTMAMIVAGVIGAGWWISRPVDRISVVVAPLANQSGYADLNQFRFALSYLLATGLADSSRVRVVPYEQFLEIVGPYRVEGADVSSQEALQALAKHGVAEVILVPTLLQENGTWRARVELRDPATATSVAVLETEPLVSTLGRETARTLMSSLALEIEEHFVDAGSTRASILDALWSSMSEPTTVLPALRPLEAAKSFESGLDAYERLEYDAALRSFTDAAVLAKHPLAEAWRSRVAALMRQDDEAKQAGDDAARLIREPFPVREQHFIEAVVAEARLDFGGAEDRYRKLVAEYPDDPSWATELAAFLERRRGTRDAILAYQQALTLAPNRGRLDVELCRLYNRASEPASAVEHGRRAVAKYESMSNKNGVSLAMLCLADALRAGSDADRSDARRYADTALKQFNELGSTYNAARGYYYVAMIAALQGNLPESIEVGQQALRTARMARNAVLEPLVLMNLGVAHARMRDQARAIEYYRQSSAGFEALGDELRAAQNHLNAGWLVIDYGGDLDAGRRDVLAALAVVEKLGDKSFEVSCRHAIAMYHYARGSYGEAETQLNRAMELAKDRSLDETMATLMIDSAVVRFERADYEAARSVLDTAIGEGRGPDAPRGLIRRAQVLTRVGDFESARDDLARAERLLEERRNVALNSLLRLVRGELELQSGDRDRARAMFADATPVTQDGTLDPASVQAQIALAEIYISTGSASKAQSLIDQALRHARTLGRVALEGRALLAQAHLELSRHRLSNALRALDAVPQESLAMGAELAARATYWRGRVLLAGGDRSAATRLFSETRRLLENVRQSLSPPHQGSFVATDDVRTMLSGSDVR